MAGNINCPICKGSGYFYSKGIRMMCGWTPIVCKPIKIYL